MNNLKIILSKIFSYIKTLGIVKEREIQTDLLFRLSKDLAAAELLDEVLDCIRTNFRKIFNCYVGIFLWSDGKIDLNVVDSDFPLSKDVHTEPWFLAINKSSGLINEPFKDSHAYYAPLQTSKGVFGALGIELKNREEFGPKNRHLFIALANQAAVAIQRTKLADASRQVELMKEREKLHTALLNSISHDLRTPLVSIMGALSSLLQDYSSIDSKTREELLTAAYEDSDHLNRFVGNLLDMTRLEAKALKIRIEPCELRDVIGTSLQTLKYEVKRRNISINIPSDLPEIPMDFVLMMRVFVNLIDNAVKYSPAKTPIDISVTLLEDKVRIDVKDFGIGIPKDDVIKIFDKFYRAVNRQVTGTGLGLSICKGMVEAHGGRIFAVNNAGPGATISVELPLITKE
ncbi:MAG: GAF domain-containing protein [Candidatus Omnitrophica bacterium]|nr:GAF domain-containing protein [Candidatus Omnitrophota bacterium]